MTGLDNNTGQLLASGQPHGLHIDLMIPTPLDTPNPSTREEMTRRVPVALTSDGGKPTWLEHPVHRQSMDVVAIPVPQIDQWSEAPFVVDEKMGTELEFFAGFDVLVAGFPFGLSTTGALGLLIRGMVASEPAVDWQEMPTFLVDARTRPSSSGSPVFYSVPAGHHYLTVDGQVREARSYLRRFVGCYSGRVNRPSDLGIVWKAQAVMEIVNGGIRGDKPAEGQGHPFMGQPTWHHRSDVCDCQCRCSCHSEADD